MDKMTGETLLGHLTGDNLEGEAPSDAARSRLLKTVRELVPEPDAFTAANLGDGDRAVLALQGSSLFIAQATGEGADVEVSVRREPLDPARVTVRLAERIGEQATRIDWVRTWTCERDGAKFLTVKTMVSSGDPHHDDRPEVFMRALCAAVGWTVPTARE